VSPRPGTAGATAPPKTVFEKLRWPAVGAVALIVAVAAFVGARRREKPAAEPLAEYVREVAIVQAEYRKFHGRLLRDPEVERQYGAANDVVAQKNYTAAIAVLEAASKQAAVPVIFFDLGALYSATGDRSRAILAFREALARDGEYAPVRHAIDRLKWIGPREASPLTAENEPNNSTVVANLIAVGTPIEGELTPGDTDTFKFITPPAPRDIVQIEITNVAHTLELGIRISDDSLKNESANLVANPGESVTRYLTQPPNTPLFLQLWGAHNSAGPYRVALRAMKAFDEYEPNDDIFNPSRIEPGRKIEAGIMDASDTDFYVFQSPRSGPVTIEIENRSSTLIPALTTYSADRRNSAFGPDVRTPGAGLKYTFQAEEHRTYYLQVWSQALTFGKYTLTIQ
jgi:tetratricopeptide (TPR) repeat protein